MTPRPFRPVLRGLLLTGGEPRFLRADLADDRADDSQATPEPLWWPPAKIVGRYLAPYLAELAGTESPAMPQERPGVRVEVELDPEAIERQHDRHVAPSKTHHPSTSRREPATS